MTKATNECDGRREAQADEPCWGEVRYYGIDGDWFCEGHWEEREGQGYLAEPPRHHGPRVVDEMGRGCKFRCSTQPCWGKIERYGDFDDTYCEAHHPVDGVYAAVSNEAAQEAFGAAIERIGEQLSGIEDRISGCIHHLGTDKHCGGPEFVKANLWDLLAAIKQLRAQGGGS